MTKLTKEERTHIVLGTYTSDAFHKERDGSYTDRYFIFDCNHGVLNKEYNEKLVNFLQEAIKHYNPDDTDGILESKQAISVAVDGWNDEISYSLELLEKNRKLNEKLERVKDLLFHKTMCTNDYVLEELKKTVEDEK